MNSKNKVNLLLFIVTSFLVFYLFRFTDFKESGPGKYFFEKIEILKKIIDKETPNSNLTEKEIQNLKKIAEERKKKQTLFCESSYFPFLPGAKWNYKIYSSNGEDVVTFGIPAPENDTFFLDSKILSKPDWTVRTLFVCENSKIKTTDLNFLEVFLKSGYLGEPCEGQDYSFFLPDDRQIESTGSFEEKGCSFYKGVGENKLPDLKEEVLSKWKIGEKETITVPAGRFEAKKIELSLDKKQEISEGTKNVSSKITLWVSREVGILKIITETKNENEEIVKSNLITQELVSFQVPTEKDDKIKHY